MIDGSDGVPEPIVFSERSRRVTTEYCPERLEGLRCMLAKGHEGMHECLAKQGIACWSQTDQP